MPLWRKNGISVLLAAQNEEEILEASAESFLALGDEIIIVSNGSTDRTDEIGRELASRHAEIQFYAPPDLPDLYHNRQFALARSRYRWVVRADADYVCLDEVESLRRDVLANRSKHPVTYSVPMISLVGDFWHTGRENLDHITSELRTSYKPAPPPLGAPMRRIYRTFRGFEFTRLGRWEGVKLPKEAETITWDCPAWFHCSIKSERNMFFRSERTNWRELGDFDTYPSLEDYIRSVCLPRYRVDSIDAAIERFMKELFFPSLRPYDPDEWGQYPRRLLEKMDHDPVYRILHEDGRAVRRERVVPALSGGERSPSAGRTV